MTSVLVLMSIWIKLVRQDGSLGIWIWCRVFDVPCGQVEESELDRLHSEQQTQGDNKYSTIQKVSYPVIL